MMASHWIPAIRTRSAMVMAILSAMLFQCKEDDPAPIVCYMTSLTEVQGGNVYLQTISYNEDNTVGMVSYIGGGLITTVTYSYGPEGRAISADYVGVGLPAKETFEYDDSGNLIKAEFRVGSTLSTSEYSYNSDGQLVQAIFKGNNYEETDDYVYPDNTTKNYSSVNYSYRVGSVTTEGSNEYEYDDKHNPKHRIPGEALISKNNTVRKKATIGGNVSVTNYDYTYNDNGYPISTTISTIGSSISHSISYQCK